MPENEIYSFLKANDLTTKSEKDFLDEYADSSKARELHGFFVDNDLTEKDFDSFYGEYLKKKEEVGVSGEDLVFPEKELTSTLITKEEPPEGFRTVEEKAEKFFQEKEEKPFIQTFGRPDEEERLIAFQAEEREKRDKRKKEYQELVDTSLPVLEESLRDVTSQLNEKIEAFEPLWRARKDSPEAEEAMQKASDELTLLEKQHEYLTDARDLLKTSKKYIETSDAGVLKAMFNKPLAKDFFSLGVSEIARNVDIFKVAQKVKDGKDITEDEQMALYAYGLNQLIESDVEQGLGSMVGAGIAETIPFMAQLALTGPLSAAGKSAAKKAVTGSIKKMTKNKLGKLTATALSDLTGAAVRTTAMSDFYKGITERMVGEIQPEVDAEGVPTGKFVEGTQLTPWEATKKSFASTFSTVLIEDMGRYGNKLFGKVKGKLSTNSMSQKIGDNTIDQVKDAVSFQGFMSEYAEELADAYVQSALEGEYRLREIYSPKEMLATALTVGAISGTFSGANMALRGMTQERPQAVAELRFAQSELQPETVVEIDNVLKGEDMDKNAEQLDLYIKKKVAEGANRDDVKKIQDYAVQKTRMDALGESEEAVQEEAIKEDEAPKEAVEVGEKEVLEVEPAEEEKGAETPPEPEVEPKKEKDGVREQQEEIDEKIEEKKGDEVQAREEPRGEEVGKVEVDEVLEELKTEAQEGIVEEAVPERAEVSKPETEKEADKNIQVLEGEKASLQETLKEVPEDQKEKIQGEIENLDSQIQKQKGYAKEIREEAEKPSPEERVEREEGEGIRVRDAEKDRLEAEKPEKKKPLTKQDKIDKSQTVEELNTLIAKNEAKIGDKPFMVKMAELRDKGFYTEEGLPENVRNTRGFEESKEYNKSIEDHFKSEPTVKATGFGFDIDSRMNNPKHLHTKYLKKEGLLPKSVYEEWVKKQGRINAVVQEGDFLVRDFKKALKKAYGKTKTGTAKVSSEDLELINDVMQQLGTDKVDRAEILKQLPEGIRGPVSRMRDHIDAMSLELVRTGLVEGQLTGKIQDNLGYYMTRTYRVHNDKKWKWENIPDETKIRAAKVIKGEMVVQGLNNFINGLEGKDIDKVRDRLKKEFKIDENGESVLSPEQIEFKAKELAADKSIPEKIQNQLMLSIVQSNDIVEGKMREMVNSADWSAGAKKTLGAKDLGILQRRKDIPVEIRELLGEYKDPSYNYITSIVKMADLIERHKFLEAAKAQGLGIWLHSKPTGDFSYKIAGEKSPTLAPLNGLYTSKDIYDEFKRSTPIDVPTWLRYYMTLVGAAKYAKTILSPITHVRNFYSNFMFHVANGRLDFTKGGKPVKSIIDLIRNKDDNSFRDYYTRLIELGVIGESVRANELKKSLNESWLYQTDFGKYGDNIFSKQKLKAPFEWTRKAYQMEDDVHKIYAFEAEKKRYKKVFKEKNPDMTDAELDTMSEEKAAEIVRSTMPTYSELPKLIQNLNRFPLTGTFVSFPAEVIRTSFNTAQLINTELRDPDTRSIGAKRLIGFMSAATLTGTLSLMSRMLMGLDDRDEDNFKKFLAPWSKNSDIIMVSDKGNGKYTYIDLGFSDPYNYLKKSANAVQSGLRGKDMDRALADAAWELLEPFLGVDMLTSRMADLYANKQKANGRPIYYETDQAGNKFIDMLNYLLEGAEPGAISTGKRIAKAYRNKINDFGGTSTPENEIMGVLLGQKIQTLDVGRAYYWKAKESIKLINQATDIYQSELNKAKKGYKADPEAAYRRATNALNRHLEEARQDYLAAQSLGVPQKELDKTLATVLRQSYSSRKIGGSIAVGIFPVIDKETGRLRSKE